MTDITALLLTYGPLGAICIAFLTGLIVAKPTHQREIQRADKAELLLSQTTRVLERMVQR